MNEQPMVEPPFPADADTSEEETARMSEVSRASNIFLAPGETFEDVNRKPTWVFPLLITLAFTLGVGFLLHTKVLTSEAFERITREKMLEAFEKQGAAPPPEEALQEQLKLIKTINQYWYITAILGLLVLLPIVAGFYYVILLLFQAETNFKKVFSVVTWSWMAQSVGSGIVGIITLLVRAPETIDPTNPFATNLAAFLSVEETPPTLYALAGSLDIFTIFFLILASIGFSKVSKKTSVGTAAMAVFIGWGLYVLGKVGIAAFQS
ncbi:MAG: YIP1 family protein [Acidobacteriota bacterium]|nr:YIP1 family protein [Blastocatellia bacterium]MDW8239290.1 YIP1 family protein [Acidobacteriota bacterium]